VFEGSVCRKHVDVFLLAGSNTDEWSKVLVPIVILVYDVPANFIAWIVAAKSAIFEADSSSSILRYPDRTKVSRGSACCSANEGYFQILGRSRVPNGCPRAPADRWVIDSEIGAEEERSGSGLSALISNNNTVQMSAEELQLQNRPTFCISPRRRDTCA